MMPRLFAALAYAALLAYDQAGIKTGELLDGTDDDECAARNGKIVTVAEAKGIRDHPNGTLCVVPLIA